jgi:rod shape determining protein RodA
MGKHTSSFDWIAFLLLLCLFAFGLFLLLTLGLDVFWQQLVFILIAIVLLFLFSRIDPALLWWFAPFAYVIGCVFLALSYLGPSIRGATRWIMIGGAQFQPSELAKPLFLLAFAYFIHKYSPRNLKYLPLHLGLFLIPFLLVFKQPDLGSSLIYGSFWLAMMLAGGLSVSIIVGATALSAMAFPFFWSHLLPYQKNRVVTFLDPAHDPGGAGYNALQAMIAVGSGQFIGRGLGRGTQSHLRFLPEHHTDFIFATLIEELGFLGGLLLLVLYALLLIRIIAPLLRPHTDHPGFFSFTLGIFAMLLAQIFINAAMNMGILPITGITLPLVSYGGSSILSLAMCFGLLWALGRNKQGDGSIAIS